MPFWLWKSHWGFGKPAFRKQRREGKVTPKISCPLFPPSAGSICYENARCPCGTLIFCLLILTGSLALVTARFDKDEENNDPVKREQIRVSREYTLHRPSDLAAVYPQSRDRISSVPRQFSGLQTQPSVYHSLLVAPVAHLRC